MKKLSIIIPTYNRSLYTRICTMALEATLRDRDDVEVIFVDNGSTDDTRHFLTSLRSDLFRLIPNAENRGFAVACNQGAEAARGSNLIFLNNDTVPLPGWYEPLEATLGDPSVGIAGSKLLFPDDTIQHAGVVFTERLVPVHMYYLFPRNYSGSNRIVDYQAVTGACLAIRRELFLDVGGFDDGYRNSYEDIDLCLRVGTLKYRIVYHPRSLLYHFESSSEGRRNYDELNRSRFEAKWSKCIVPDEPSRYKSDGFVSVPRLPIRQLSQVVTQLDYERQHTYSLVKVIEALDAIVRSRSLPEASSASGSWRFFLETPLPAVAASGQPLHLAFRFQLCSEQSQTPPLEIRYEWASTASGIAMWHGRVVEFGSEGFDADDGLIRAQVVAPAPPGDYHLSLSLSFPDREEKVAEYAIAVAPAFAFQCQSQLPDQCLADTIVRVLVRIRNVGARVFLGGAAIQISYHWLDQSGRNIIAWEGLRTPLTERLAPGEETIVEAVVRFPSRPGHYTLAWDLIQEGEFWFSERGANLSCYPIHVRSQGSNDPTRDKINEHPREPVDIDVQLQRMRRLSAMLDTEREGRIDASGIAETLRQQVGELHDALTAERAASKASRDEAARLDVTLTETKNVLAECAEWARGLEEVHRRHAEDINRLEGSLRQVTHWAQGLQGQLKDRDTQLATVSGWAQGLQGQLKDRDTQLATVSGWAQELQGQLKDRDTQIERLSEQADAFSNECELLRQHALADQSDLGALRESVNALTDELEEVRSALTSIQRRPLNRLLGRVTFRTTKRIRRFKDADQAL